MSPFDPSRASHEVICPICRKPVRLEDCKTDEDGQAVHERCYASRVCAKQTGYPSKN